jgi:tetratricopeptide (TPR) repeat protein
MKKLIFTFTLFIFTSVLFAQSNDYRTTEDGLNKLINNPDFIKDLGNLGTKGSLSLEKLNQYLTQYVPEYSNFKLKNTNLNLDNLYFANSSGISTDDLLGELGGALKLNPTQNQHMKNVFNGNLSFTPTNGFSKGYGNSLYERGKDPKVDYVVDYSVDMFQGKFGDGGLKSELIDMGGGVLGNLLTQMNKRYYEKLAEEEKRAIIFDDYYMHLYGTIDYYDKWKKQYVNDLKADQQDLLNHYKANQKMPNNYGVQINSDYKGAIKLFDLAINSYRQNPQRAYYLYIAYLSRAKCKMQIGGYRSAIIDYYFAQDILENILNGKLQDKSIKNSYPTGYFDIQNKKTFKKGKIETSFGSLNENNLIDVLIGRAFAKYRLKDFKGAISDCNLVKTALINKKITPTGKPNDYKDINKGIIAMSQFGLDNFEESYISFLEANLNDDLISDSDLDGLSNLLDQDDHGESNVLDSSESFESIEYCGIPAYFPFDLVQIKGLCFYKANKKDEAIEAYEKIIDSENGNPKKGIIAWKTFTRVGGDISSVYSTLGSFYFSKGDKSKAISLLDEAIKINPNQLEFYFKRGTYKKALGKIKEAEEDFKIVKNPTILKKTDTKKSLEYYATKITEYNANSNNEELYYVLKDAIKDYQFIGYRSALIKCLYVLKSPTKALEIANMMPADSKEAHFFKSMQEEFSGNLSGEEAEMFLAFDNGLNFNELKTFFNAEIQEKPYYCKLFLKYASKTNNNFLSLNIDKVKMGRMLDSISNVNSEKYKNVKGMNKTMEKFSKKHKAKTLGNIEDYLELLNDEMFYGSPEAVDKIECLIILGRKEEAFKFAKKIKSKLLKIDPKLMHVSDACFENFYSGACQ